uniref:NADH-ubiquinone oxidoreductase chain 4 n=1 Tax=Derotettix mendosensis TaxID=2219932 RepID=A0A3S5GLB8_9HEMI|nr:NADH dehydrogenase subunit 4 [Derotettix mendosensis]
MLKLIMYLLFMIPICFMKSSIMVSCFSMILLLLIMKFNYNIHVLNYFMGMDMISYGLVILTLWMSIMMIMTSKSYKNFHLGFFLLLVLFLSLFLLMAFFSISLIMFYIFFESSLIPTIIIIMGWGYQPERVTASYYLLFYTLFASLPLLMAIMYLYDLYNVIIIFNLIDSQSKYLYLSLTFAFFVKMPMFMFHFWLPKAHVEAPVSGSMILAGVLLKLGGYGLIRVMNMIPNLFYNYSFIWISISIIGGIIISFLCLVQVDIKSMIAYSSVAHMGLVISGIMTMKDWGVLGAYYLMIGHGLCSSGLFCLANITYERLGTRSLFVNKGLMNLMPSMTMMWFLFCANNISCPPSISLTGEIMIINSMMSWDWLSMILLFPMLFMSACYSLYLFSVTQHGLLYSGLYSFSPGEVREFLIMIMHFMPLNLFIVNLNLLL